MFLKGHFHISTQELYNTVTEAEKETRSFQRKREKKKGKAITYKTESEEDIKEEVINQSVSEIGDCITVDVE